MLLEELIEKAFSDGYEYALMEQREFAHPGLGAGKIRLNGVWKKTGQPRLKGSKLHAKDLTSTDRFGSTILPSYEGSGLHGSINFKGNIERQLKAGVGNPMHNPSYFQKQAKSVFYGK